VNELSGFIKVEQFIDKLSDSWLFRNDLSWCKLSDTCALFIFCSVNRLEIDLQRVLTMVYKIKDY
jgi:hypothetical protein